jgi:hypothetical protein
MKITTWNVNGLRAALGKGVLDWVRKYEADVLCLQECARPGSWKKAARLPWRIFPRGLEPRAAPRLQRRGYLAPAAWRAGTAWTTSASTVKGGSSSAAFRLPALQHLLPERRAG